MSLILCKTDGTFLGNMNGLIPSSVSLVKNLTDLWELTFEVNRWIGDENGEITQSDFYDSIDEMMWLYLTEDETFFIIDS